MNREVITVFADTDKQLFIDCTIGLGGHSYYMLKNFKQASLIAIDVDNESMAQAKNNLKKFQGRVTFYCLNFIDIFEKIDLTGLPVSGVLVDPGISMYQLREQGRGFSHSLNSKLDMRKDKSIKINATDVLNSFTEAQLIEIFEKYGELEKPKELAKKVIERRLFGSLDTSFKLKKIVEQVYGKKIRKGKVHPAAKVFQALRIFVNKELEGIDVFLQKIPQYLQAGAKIIYLSYHSIEDRIVKNTLKFLQESQKINIIKPFPMFPSRDEILENPASHSARLRAAEVI
ncbi:MAG: 16S rRNA (cytosine(1402)-N(4))-methyltransferase RsmH [Candidatus Aminicenantes bacterium]|nr:16S rRNA (cytosine(1402)-N(4))-methyltransferase RsmH [Candidatus Aminicenantes bacterium]